MTDNDKKLVAQLREDAVGLRECGFWFHPQAERIDAAAARIESLSAEVKRVTKERDSLQQQLRQIRGTDQWRD